MGYTRLIITLLLLLASVSETQALESDSTEIVLSVTDLERLDRLIRDMGDVTAPLTTFDERSAKSAELRRAYVGSATGTVEWCAYMVLLGYDGVQLARCGQGEKAMPILEKYMCTAAEAPAIYNHPEDLDGRGPRFWYSQGPGAYVEAAHKAGKENHARQFLLSVKEIFADKLKRAASVEERQKIERAKSFADKEIDNNLAVLAATPTPVKPKKKAISRASVSTESSCCGAKVASATGSKTDSEPQSGSDSCCGSAVKSATGTLGKSAGGCSGCGSAVKSATATVSKPATDSCCGSAVKSATASP